MTVYAIYNLHLGTTKIGKRYSLGQARKSAAANAVEREFSRRVG